MNFEFEQDISGEFAIERTHFQFERDAMSLPPTTDFHFNRVHMVDRSSSTVEIYCNLQFGESL